MSDVNPPTSTSTPSTTEQLGGKRPRAEETTASPAAVGGGCTTGGAKPKTFLIRHTKVRSDAKLISWMLYDFREVLGISSWFESKVTLAKTNAVASHQDAGGDGADDVTPSTAVPQTPSGEGAVEGDDNDDDADVGAAPKVLAAGDVEHESTGVLKPNAPVQCVYVDFSRKPYFLLEWCCVRKGGDDGGMEELIQPSADTVKLLESKLLELNGREYKGVPIEVMVALPGTTVAAQRAKVSAVHKAAAVTSNAAAPPSGGGGDRPVAPAAFVAPKKMVPRAFMMRKK